MAPRELLFTGLEDVDEFLFTYEFVLMRGKSDEDMVFELPRYLSGEAFKFFRENFTGSFGPSEFGKSFKWIKKKMHEEYAPKMTAAEAAVQAVSLKYGGGDLKEFVYSSEKLFDHASLSSEIRYGLIMEAIKSVQDLLEFLWYRGPKTYEELKESCYLYEEYRIHVEVEEVDHIGKDEVRHEELFRTE